MSPWSRRVGVLVVVLALLVGAGAGIALAKNTSNVSQSAPYYNNTSRSYDNASWMRDHHVATLPNVTDYAVRIGGFVVGSRAAGQSQGAGSLVTGILVMAAMVGLIGGVGIGLVAGVTLGTAMVGALIVAGLAPQWMWVLVLMGLGLVATQVVLRVLR